jgi:hypothetical protein
VPSKKKKKKRRKRRRRGRSSYQRVMAFCEIVSTGEEAIRAYFYTFPVVAGRD